MAIEAAFGQVMAVGVSNNLKYDPTHGLKILQGLAIKARNLGLPHRLANDSHENLAPSIKTFHTY